MKAVLIDEFGGVEVLKVGEAERPAPKSDEVLIKVVATSINRPDLVQREGKYPPPPGDSEILGLEVAGTVVACGDGASGWKIGDHVCALTPGGGYAEYCLAEAGHCLPVPQGLPLAEAAALRVVEIGRAHV